MFELKSVTRTKDTEAAYIKQASNLLENYSKQTGLDWTQSKYEFIEWIYDKRASCSPAYWRRVKASLVFFFDLRGAADLSDSISSMSSDQCAAPTHTSANKKKSVSDAELVALTNYFLVTSNSSASLDALHFLTASLITGMRPSEWERATLKIISNGCEFDFKEFYDNDYYESKNIDGITIVVQNAKATNGRANGDFRTLSFPHLHPQEIDALLDHWRSVDLHRQQGTFPIFQRQCSDKLRYAGKILWPRKKRRISLYSARHQSMANAKASSLPATVIAAMHGHATDRTAGDHYGRKRFGVAGRVYFEVPDDEIAKVRKVPKNFDPHARANRAKTMQIAKK
jgi:hypothetical protein